MKTRTENAYSILDQQKKAGALKENETPETFWNLFSNANERRDAKRQIVEDSQRLAVVICFG